MQSTTLFDQGHKWIMFARDPEKPEKILDTNQYMVVAEGGQALLLDPGGIELFAPMLSVVLKHIEIDQLQDLFASHQDPDIISSLGMWDQVLDNGRLHAPWIWEGFIRHFGMENIEYCSIEDEGGVLRIGSLELQLVPAHYLHSSGNFSVYDKHSKILFSGDIGAAIEGADADLYIEDFDQHTRKMQLFHQRWMPSNRAKQVWIDRVRKLDVQMMLPQHGRIFRGDDVGRFLDWFEQLDVGIPGRNIQQGVNHGQ